MANARRASVAEPRFEVSEDALMLAVDINPKDMADSNLTVSGGHFFGIAEPAGGLKGEKSTLVLKNGKG